MASFNIAPSFSTILFNLFFINASLILLYFFTPLSQVSPYPFNIWGISANPSVKDIDLFKDKIILSIHISIFLCSSLYLREIGLIYRNEDKNFKTINPKIVKEFIFIPLPIKGKRLTIFLFFITHFPILYGSIAAISFIPGLKISCTKSIWFDCIFISFFILINLSGFIFNWATFGISSYVIHNAKRLIIFSAIDNTLGSSLFITEISFSTLVINNSEYLLFW